MQTLLTIGDFSRMTYLSVKALRHYHEIGLLEPAAVDPGSGYRRYLPEQVGAAQVIRRLRDLGMPLEGIRSVINADDVDARNATIVEHLRRMEHQLEQTQSAVASLRALLDEPIPSPLQVDYRVEPPVRTLAITDRIGMDEAESWWENAFDRLHSTVAELGWRRLGPDGALWHAEFFQADAGDVVAFVPVAPSAGEVPAAGVTMLDLPATEVAVTVHTGPFADLDRAYAALGVYVAERAIGLDGPIRENYLVTSADTPDQSRHRTEVCWPIFQTKPTTGARA